MAIDRRNFLRLGAGTIAALALPAPLRAGERPLYVSSTALPGGGFAAAILDEAGTRLLTLPIEARGHDAAADPVRRRAVLFARRPGRFALVIDLDRPRTPNLFAPPDNRHFNGHGVFSPDGKLLYATENDIADATGRLGIYDVGAGFRRIGEFETHGLGPHEVVLSPDGERLIVANGGIETDPEIGGGRHDLNTANMEPSLVELDRRTGTLRLQQGLATDLAQLSIRHLAFDAAGNTWFGCQWAGDPVEHPPLVGKLGGDGKLSLVPIDRRPLLAARNYIGALAANRDGSLIAASCPRGGTVLVFDAATGRLVAETSIPDTSAVAPAGPRQFLAGSGDGGVYRLDEAGQANLLSRSAERYDNHLRWM